MMTGGFLLAELRTEKIAYNVFSNDITRKVDKILKAAFILVMIVATIRHFEHK